jgi:excisionase family DNA binding protein
MELLTTNEAAKRLGLRPRTVRLHVKTGRIQAVRHGRIWRIPAGNLPDSASLVGRHALREQGTGNIHKLHLLPTVWRHTSRHFPSYSDLTRRNNANLCFPPRKFEKMDFDIISNPNDLTRSAR